MTNKRPKTTKIYFELNHV